MNKSKKVSSDDHQMSVPKGIGPMSGICWLNRILWDGIVTFCNSSSCRKVMFSQAYIKNSVHRWACVVGGMHGGGGGMHDRGACMHGSGMPGRGPCMVEGMHGRGCAWLGACMAGGSVQGT